VLWRRARDHRFVCARDDDGGRTGARACLLWLGRAPQLRARSGAFHYDADLQPGAAGDLGSRRDAGRDGAESCRSSNTGAQLEWFALSGSRAAECASDFASDFAACRHAVEDLRAFAVRPAAIALVAAAWRPAERGHRSGARARPRRPGPHHGRAAATSLGRAPRVADRAAEVRRAAGYLRRLARAAPVSAADSGFNPRKSPARRLPLGTIGGFVFLTCLVDPIRLRY